MERQLLTQWNVIWKSWKGLYTVLYPVYKEETECFILNMIFFLLWNEMNEKRIWWVGGKEKSHRYYVQEVNLVDRKTFCEGHVWCY